MATLTNRKSSSKYTSLDLNASDDDDDYSSSGDITASTSFLAPKRNKKITHQELVQLEESIQKWIESSLKISFDVMAQDRSESAMFRSVPSRSDIFYDVLESGEILCQLLHRFYPQFISMEHVYLSHHSNNKNQQQQQQQEDDMNNIKRFSQSNDNVQQTSFLTHSRANIKVFIQGVQNVVGPQLAFTFEDVYLKRNKDLIVDCLNELMKQSAASSNKVSSTSAAAVEKSLKEPTVEKVIASEPPLARRKSVERVVVLPKQSKLVEPKPVEKVVTKSDSFVTKAKSTPLSSIDDTKAQVHFAEQGFLNLLIGIYGLPFVIIWVIISKFLLGK